MFIGYLEIKSYLIKKTATESAVISIDFGSIKDDQENLNEIVLNCKKELKEYFEGKRKEFSFPYELSGTDFQKKVWHKLLDIPYGKTVSYKDVASAIGNEKVVRAVANAIGANKLLIVIPCHRVIGSNGKLTGFRGGIDKKELLLKHEGIML